MNELDQISDGDAFGEAPVWDGDRQRLLWSDITSKVVYQYHPTAGRKSVLHSHACAYGMVLNSDGALISSGPTGLQYLAGGADPAPLAIPDLAQPPVFNDMCADRRGRIYTGSIYWADGGIVRPGNVYLIDGNGAAAVGEGILLSNGLGLSLDDRTLFLTDSFASRIYAYQVDPGSGALSGRRVFASIGPADGMPDGLAVDSEGFVWSALWYCGQIVRFDPDGREERRLTLPVRQVSSMAFGGRDLDELYITTAGDPFVSALSPPGYDYQAGNHGGPLYRARPGVRGRPEYRSAFTAPAPSHSTQPTEVDGHARG